MTFDEWLNEQEGFGLRSERFFGAFETGTIQQAIDWLRAAYNVGYQQGQIDERDEIEAGPSDPNDLDPYGALRE